MKKTILVSIMAVLGMGMASQASADSYAPRIDRMERELRQEIREARRHGDLTRKEAKILRKEQRRIARLRDDFESDGWLSKKERRVLRKRYKKAGRHIDHFKHNDRHRQGDRYRWSYDYYDSPRVGFYLWDDNYGWYGRW